MFAGLFSDPTFNHFSSSFCLWMKPDRADVVVIKGKRSDGPEAFAQTFLKLSPFVGTYAAVRPFQIWVLQEQNCGTEVSYTETWGPRKRKSRNEFSYP